MQDTGEALREASDALLRDLEALSDLEATKRENQALRDRIERGHD